MKSLNPLRFVRWSFLGLAVASFSVIHLHAADVSASPTTTTTTAAKAKAKPSVPDSKDMKDAKEIKAPVAEKSGTPLTVRLGLPLWSSAISGSIGLKGHVSAANYISFTDIYNHLDYVIPGSMELGYGKWGLLVDGQYTKLSDNITSGVPLIKSGSIQLNQAFADINFSYKVIDTEEFTLAPFIGTRIEYVKLHTQIDSKFPLLFPGVNVTGSDAWADPILGLQLRYRILKPLSLVAKADVGGFGAASKLTYQAEGGLETQITRCFYSSLTYRYLSTDYTDGGFTYNLAFQGPQITFGVNF